MDKGKTTLDDTNSLLGVTHERISTFDAEEKNKLEDIVTETAKQSTNRWWCFSHHNKGDSQNNFKSLTFVQAFRG